MVSNSSQDLEAWFIKVNNREPEMEIQNKDLAAYSESMNKGRLQEDSDKTQGNGKGSKRKAWKMEGKVEQEWKIVSVSRLTGGKDRHSKVITAKGLRDRRVRLSVPTAIQLYDLQERLGYDQPSKAVGWLIKAAESAIDELPVLNPEMDSASADNVAQLNSSNCYNADHCVGSPRESATAVTGSAFTAFRVGLGSAKAQGRNSHKAINREPMSIATLRGSDLGRSSSSISDGSIKGSAEHTSNCSVSEPTSRIEARLKASELATKKSVSAKNSGGGSPPAIDQLNSMQPFLTSYMLKSIFPDTPLLFESKSSKDNNPCGIHTQILSGTDNVQQLWDYNSRPSYTDMLCTRDSHQLQDLASSSTAPLQKSFPRVPSTPGSHIGNSCLQSYEMADSAISFFDPKQSRPFGGNAEQGQANLSYSNFPNMITKRVEQQRQQQAQMHIKHYASTIVPTFSNDINFLTSSLSSREPHQSISSSITNMSSLSHTHKNAYGEASANAAHDFVPSQDYEARVFPGFQYAGQRKA